MPYEDRFPEHGVRYKNLGLQYIGSITKAPEDDLIPGALPFPN